MWISVEDVKPALESMYMARDEMVPCFIGAPGIGKTQGIHEFAREQGVKVVTFILSNTVPSEVSGIRMPDKDTRKLVVFDDMQMSSLEDGDILFFDEVFEAPEMLQTACLSLIQDRILASGRKLPDVYIVAASNGVATPGIIDASVRNRFQFMQVKFGWSAWSEWFNAKFGIYPDKRLKDKLAEDSDQYNILTPREATKLYVWLRKSGVTPFNLKIISHMFDASVAEIFRDMALHKRSKQRQVIDAVHDLTGMELPSEFESLSLRMLFDKLQQLDNWEEVAAALATVELEEEENIEIEF